MSYADSLALVQAPGFADRVILSVLKAAIDIMNETVDAEHPEVTAKRVALAQKLIWSGGQSEFFVKFCAINPAIAAAGPSAPDGDIDFVVSSAWNAMAGVTPGDVA